MTVRTGFVPDAHPDDMARVRNAAHLAKTVLPGAIGDYLCRELTEWCRNGHRWDKGGEALKIVDHLNALATDKATTSGSGHDER